LDYHKSIKGGIMKRLTLMLLLISILTSYKKDNPKVLLYIEDNSMDQVFMLTHEGDKMFELLKKSGLEVTIATISGELIKADTIIIKPNIKLGDVNVSEYSGFIMPCMASYDTVVTSTEKDFIRKVISEGKPIAAQTAAVLILTKADALNGKKYDFPNDNMTNPDMYLEFKSGRYSGNGIIQDGNIITSGLCPMHAKVTGSQDGTVALTQTLIQEIKTRTK
jgi:putative intracellular protease/amidase